MTLQKSVSPIIATILLILVVVIITTIILNWGSTFVKESTHAADEAIDFSCVGADIKIVSCNYNSSEEKISVALSNTGKVDFSTSNEFFAILSDANDTFETKSNVFASESLDSGTSKLAYIDVTGLSTPISLKINSSVCPTVEARATCK